VSSGECGFIGHALMENRNGLFVDVRQTKVSRDIAVCRAFIPQKLPQAYCAARSALRNRGSATHPPSRRTGD
jgi:hypothetical protein